MRRLIGVLLTGAGLAATTLGVGLAAPAPTRSVAAAGWRQHPVHRVVYIRGGAEAQCDPQLCSHGGGEGTFLLPGRGLYRVVVTMSFEYRTTGDGNFRTSLGFFGPAVRPAQWPLAASSEATSTTLVYTTQLKGGKYLSLAPAVDNRRPSTGTWSIAMGHVVAVVDARPVATP